MIYHLISRSGLRTGLLVVGERAHFHRSRIREGGIASDPKEERSGSTSVSQVLWCWLCPDGFSFCGIRSNTLPADNVSSKLNRISPIFSFLQDIVILFVRHSSSPVIILLRISSYVDAHVIMSSTIFIALGNPSINFSECLHHSSEDAFRPIGALKYLHLPSDRRNVVRSELSLSRPGLK